MASHDSAINYIGKPCASLFTYIQSTATFIVKLICIELRWSGGPSVAAILGLGRPSMATKI